jgi:hypothetical protein
MEYGKYIIKEVRGFEVAIVFSSLISHCDIGTKGDSRGGDISAGFFSVRAKASEKDPDDISVGVWGKSITLKLDSRKEDAALIKEVLRKEDKY